MRKEIKLVQLDKNKYISGKNENSVYQKRGDKMSEIVDRRNLDFILFEMLKIQELFEEERYQDYDRDAVGAMLDVSEQIAEKYYLPIAGKLDANEPQYVDGKVQIIPEVGEAIAAFANAGMFGVGFDEDVGGLQLPWVVTTAINGLFMAANLAVANYAFLTVAAANMLNAFGDDTQKSTFLPAMLTGKWFGTMCLSEPNAGSSLGDITTRAIQNDDGSFNIIGSKMWISGGDHEMAENIIHMVLAKTNTKSAGVKGISLFIVPKYKLDENGKPNEFNHVALAGLNHKMGQRGTVNCLLNFGEAGDTVGYMIGEPNNGLKYMFHMMNEARVGVGHASVMSGLAGYLHSLAYAKERRQGRLPYASDPSNAQVPIIAHADVKRMLLMQKSAVEGGLALTSYCAYLVDKQKVCNGDVGAKNIELLLGILTPVAKSWPAEHCLEANKWAMQVLGGYGYARDYPVERHYRDNRLNHIHEGTFGIQGRDVLGRKMQIENGRCLQLLKVEMQKTMDEARQFGQLSDQVKNLSAALFSVELATRKVVDCKDKNISLANATLYLDAFGIVVVAWLWLWQGVIALQALTDDDLVKAEVGFYQGKYQCSKYFYTYELPKIYPSLNIVAELDDICVTMDEDYF